MTRCKQPAIEQHRRRAACHCTTGVKRRRGATAWTRCGKKNQLIGVFPSTASIIFIIDTSALCSPMPGNVLGEMEATSTSTPTKGIQVMNDMGNYHSRDTPVSGYLTRPRRQLILRNLANWSAFSNSSPVEGITQAVRSFYDRDKKISSTSLAMNLPADPLKKSYLPSIG